jgi:uncharacterized protein
MEIDGSQQEVYRLPAMSVQEVDRLLSESRICRMALNDSPQPYIIPLDYAYVSGNMYFHFANYGRKVELFKKDPHVSVEVDRYNSDITEYESVTLMGTLALVTNTAEKKTASRALMERIDAQGEKANIAARHGYERIGPDTLEAGGSLILRLDIADYVALRSPGP